MTRLIGIVIILFGAGFALIGGLSPVAAFWAFAKENFGDFSGAGGSVFLTIGLASIGYGWQCVKGFGRQGNNCPAPQD